MRITQADWSGFADYLLEELLGGRDEITLDIDSIGVGAHTDAANYRQHWWWDAQSNPAHPQYNNFFHNMIEITVSPKSGPVREVTFTLRKRGLTGRLVAWFRKLLLKPHELAHRSRHPAEIAEFGDFIDTRVHKVKEVHLKPDTLKFGLRTHEDLNHLQEKRSSDLRRLRKVLAAKRIDLDVDAEPAASGNNELVFRTRDS